MKNSSRGWLSIIILLCLFTCTKAKAQERIPLKEILSFMETSFNVRFSYRDQDIMNLSVNSPAQEMDLTKLLEFLEEQTDLEFEALDSRYITISLHSESINFCGIVKDGI